MTKFAIKGLKLLPTQLPNMSIEDERNMLSVFGQDRGMPHPIGFNQELRLWKARWAGQKNSPQTLKDTLLPW